MKKIIILLIILLFIASCDYLPTSTGGEEDEIVGCPINFACVGGSDGVNIEIVNPGTSVKVDQRIYVGGEKFIPSVMIYDEGESDTEGEICITGMDENAFTGFSGCDCDDYMIIVQDEEDYYENEQILHFEPGYTVKSGYSGEYVMTFINRYTYETYGIVDVCLKQSPSSKEGCDASGEILKKSSGAPLKVTSVAQTLKTLGSNAVTLTLTYDVEEQGGVNEGLINEETLYSGQCFDPSEDYPAVKVSFVLLNQAYACPDLVFEEAEMSGTCVVSGISTEGSSGEYLFADEDTFQGYLQFEYVWEEIESVNFRVQDQ